MDERNWHFNSLAKGNSGSDSIMTHFSIGNHDHQSDCHHGLTARERDGSSRPSRSVDPSCRKRRARTTDPTERRFVGVRQRSSGRWLAEVKDTVDNSRLWTGTFDSAEEAARAYDDAARVLLGVNTRSNFPPSDNLRQEGPSCELRFRLQRATAAAAQKASPLWSECYSSLEQEDGVMNRDSQFSPNSTLDYSLTADQSSTSSSRTSGSHHHDDMGSSLNSLIKQSSAARANLRRCNFEIKDQFTKSFIEMCGSTCKRKGPAVPPEDESGSSAGPSPRNILLSLGEAMELEGTERIAIGGLPSSQSNHTKRLRKSTNLPSSLGESMQLEGSDRVTIGALPSSQINHTKRLRKSLCRSSSQKLTKFEYETPSVSSSFNASLSRQHEAAQVNLCRQISKEWNYSFSRPENEPEISSPVPCRSAVQNFIGLGTPATFHNAAADQPSGEPWWKRWSQTQDSYLRLGQLREHELSLVQNNQLLIQLG